jgi:hypothetical protein
MSLSKVTLLSCTWPHSVCDARPLASWVDYMLGFIHFVRFNEFTYVVLRLGSCSCFVYELVDLQKLIERFTQKFCYQANTQNSVKVSKF